MIKPVGKWYHWILLSLLGKGIIFLFLAAELGRPGDNFMGILNGDQGGDVNSYLTPVENLIRHGEYSPDYRMPGHAAPYYILRLFFDIKDANNAFVILQLLLGSISVYILALTALRLFNSTRLFYLVFCTYLVSTYTQIFDMYVLSEGLTVSLSVFALYFFVKGMQEKSRKDLFLCGLCTTWVLFLRPVYSPYLFIFAIVLLYVFLKELKYPVKKATIYFLFLVLPFIVIDGAWIIRNFMKYQRIQPLTKSVYYPDIEGSYFFDLMEFLRSWGGSYIFWDPSAEIRLLGIESSSFGIQLKTNENLRLPDDIYTSQFNADSLAEIRRLVLAMQNKQVSSDSLPLIKSLVHEKLTRYTESVKAEHPFQYHVQSRLRYFKLFLLHSGTYNLMRDSWNDLNLHRRLVKIFYSLLYLSVLAGGIAGTFMLLFKRKQKLAILLPLLTLYSICIFPFILRLVEMRYFVPAYPFMLLCAMYVTNELINRLNPKPVTQR